MENPAVDESATGGRENGYLRPRVGEPLAVVREYPAQWTKPRIDPAELARLRWVEGWSLERLARHYRRGVNTIYRELGRRKHSDGGNA